MLNNGLQIYLFHYYAYNGASEMKSPKNAYEKRSVAKIAMPFPG